MSGTEAMTDAAIAWHLRQQDADEVVWEEFVAWLEASPDHAAAYERVAAADRLIAGAAPRVFAEDSAPVVIDAAHRFGRRPAPVRRWGWMAGAAAIAATALAVLTPLLPGGAHPYSIETRPGETRTIALDGTRIDLNGGSRLTLDRHDARVARLDAGQALFHVRHDGSHPFSITSGDVTVTDVGTVFDVVRDGGRMSIAVAEGAVRVVGAGDPVELTAGHCLKLDDAAHTGTLAPVAAGDVGGWTGGRLSFNNEPLATVAAGLERRYAVKVTLAPGLRDRAFTGSIQLTGSAERDIPHLAALIGAGWQHRGEEWVLAAAPGGA